MLSIEYMPDSRRFLLTGLCRYGFKQDAWVFYSLVDANDFRRRVLGR